MRFYYFFSIHLITFNLNDNFKIPKFSILGSLLMKIKRNKKKPFDFSDYVFKLKEIGEIVKELLGGDFKKNFLKGPLSKINLETTRDILSETDQYGNAIIDSSNILNLTRCNHIIKIKFRNNIL
jgi:hypothetical protein